jgi:hypothetical protein
VDSELVGDWMASGYLPDGVRCDHALLLQPDGSFIWRTWYEGQRGEHALHGTWRHDHEEELLYFTPSEPGPIYGPDHPQLWRVLQLTGLEGANTFMILQWVALAVRNLPVLFYRVRVENAEQITAAARPRDVR